ncbi:hypothetical protein [Dyadobacter sp. CY347]|uniref:hypothetical protein n=1 Tax=Dyadobacter sp. CY347 TaxID=2909336 RepID=UPI001F25AA88|nr:hypothetical protein [Dyadobacter sp. CY347]MCF2490616.1 hypothetical protein [Dyadobacter sp. CY347]
MNNHLIPKSLQTAYARFATLESDEEKNELWKEMARDKDQFALGTLDMEVEKGLIALSDRVDELLKKVKQPA